MGSQGTQQGGSWSTWWAKQQLTDWGGQNCGWQTSQSHINQEEQLGSETDHATQVSSAGK